MIPFNTGMRVTGPAFCGRHQELSSLRQYMKSAGRVYLVGERRIGKTSLIFESVRTLKGYRLIYVDLMAVKTTADVVQRMASALVKSEKQQSKILALLKELAHLQPTMSIDPITNTPSIGFSPGAGDKPETLDGVFSLFESDQKTIVVFDEFQDIQHISTDDSLLARLRGLIQLQESSSFIFCGSIRSSMEDIFSNHESPFFSMAMRLYLGPLERGEFLKFLTRKFRKGSLTDALVVTRMTALSPSSFFLTANRKSDRLLALVSPAREKASRDAKPTSKSSISPARAATARPKTSCTSSITATRMDSA